MRRRATVYPLAYFFTFRTYGTWLHGDPRGSVDRHRNMYGTPLIARSAGWHKDVSSAMSRPPVYLDLRQRDVVDEAIRELCRVRGWILRALNVRAAHAHLVVSAK